MPYRWREELVPSLPFVPTEWIDYPGEWAALGSMALHMMFSENLEYVSIRED